MAILKSDLQQFVEQYQTDNKRPCPKAHIIATHGEAALDTLKALISDGTVACRRGRNGGYFPVAATTAAEVSEDAPAEAENAPQNDAPAETDNDALAEQFAALEAKLAAAEAAEQNETVPF